MAGQHVTCPKDVPKQRHWALLRTSDYCEDEVVLESTDDDRE